MNNPAENEICPYCGASAIELTVHGDGERHWLCSGADGHEWRESDDLPAPEEETPRPSLIQRLLKKVSL